MTEPSVTAVGWTARSAYLPAGEAPRQRYLDYLWLLRQTPAITEAMHLDAAGWETLLFSRLARHLVGSGVDRSQDPRFQAAKAGVLYFGAVYFRQESEPYMTIALPLRGPDAGVAIAEVNLKFFWGVISQMQIGRAGYAYVVDSGGVLIGHPDISLVLQKTAMGALPQVRAALSGAPPRGSEAQIGADLGGRKVLTAHAPMAPVGWHVFVEQPVNESFSPLLVIVASWNRIVRPRGTGIELPRRTEAGDPAARTQAPAVILARTGKVALGSRQETNVVLNGWRNT